MKYCSQKINLIVLRQKALDKHRHHSIAVLCNGVIDGRFGQTVYSIVTAKNSFKKCHGFSSYFVLFH